MSFHKITVIGYAGSEPDLDSTPTGKSVASFPVYVNERFGDEERTIRYKVKVWNKLCQVVIDHLHKGQLLIVEGVPSIEVWKSNEDEPRGQMIVTAQVLRFLGPRPITASEQEEIPI